MTGLGGGVQTVGVMQRNRNKNKRFKDVTEPIAENYLSIELVDDMCKHCKTLA